MSTNLPSVDYSLSELMAVVTAREIKDGENCFIGVGIPMLAGLLAVRTHAPRAHLIFEVGYIGSIPPGISPSVGDSSSNVGAVYVTGLFRQFSDVQRGYLDVGVLGGAQIDKYGNLNTSVILGQGTYTKPQVRLPGSGGGNDITSSVKRVIYMMRMEKRRFLNRVDFITSPGYLDGPGARERAGLLGGGPAAVITDKGIFRFDDDTKEMYLASIYPGVDVDEIKQDVEWDLRVADNLSMVEPPSVSELEVLRTLDPVDLVLGRRLLKEEIAFDDWADLVEKGWIKLGMYR